MKSVDIYTDGACSGNPGPGGWAAILIYNGRRKEISGNDLHTTNNKMELLAVIQALSALKEPCQVTLYTDSQYICNAINLKWLQRWSYSGWKKADGKPVKNISLWRSLMELMDIHSVTFTWVKGHSGNTYNEQCDQLAVSESVKAQALLKQQ